MTNDELNHYIKHYIEKDKTGRAIMLTGAWGIGKSYYIQKSLIPFLSDAENGEYQCIVISLYGLSNLAEISKAIYLDAWTKKLNIGTESGKTTLKVANTILKGVASHFGIDLKPDDKGLQSLFQSIDLSGKLIILEDVERTKISILELLGYVNSLVEQDGVKVLLVTNENEIIKYKSAKTGSSDNKKSIDRLGTVEKPGSKKLTEKSVRYLEIKEKTIGDTIQFSGDIKSAIKGIIHSFSDSAILQKYSGDQQINDIAEILFLMESNNLRSVIFACQKTADIFDRITEEDGFSEDFLSTIFYGILFFAFRLNAGSQIKWDGLNHYSLELGSNSHPLFRFCFDYIIEQRIDKEKITEAAEALKAFRLYDRSKTSADSDLQTLNGYYLHTEAEVRQAVRNIEHRLNDPEDISFFDYGTIANSLIIVKYNLGIEIEAAKELLVNNLKGRGEKLREEELFWHFVGIDDEAAREEYAVLKERMISSLNERRCIIPSFEYLPNQATMLKDYVFANEGIFYSKHGFAKYLDISRLVEMLSKCTPFQMNEVRSTFQNVYRIGNAREFFHEDVSAIEAFQQGIELTWERPEIDRVQLLHYKWFLDALSDIKKRLM